MTSDYQRLKKVGRSGRNLFHMVVGKIALGLITNRSLTRKPHVGKLSSGGGEEEEVRSGGAGGGDMRKQSEKRGQVRGSESS